MTIEKQLKIEAHNSAVNRGHRMKRFRTLTPTLFESVCWDCGGYVQVRTEPLPNEISIGGNAVALTCDGLKFRVKWISALKRIRSKRN